MISFLSVILETLLVPFSSEFSLGLIALAYVTSFMLNFILVTRASVLMSAHDPGLWKTCAVGFL